MNEKEVDRYICPNCGGTIKFNIKAQKFECTSCRGSVDVKPEKDFVEEHPIESCEQREKDGAVFDGLNAVVCQNCGSEIVFGESQTAALCPMCGSTQVISKKQSSGISPDGIIPFKVDRQDAEANFRTWIKKRWFAPNKLKTAHESGKLTGMYVPFWTYDFDVDSHYRGKGGKEIVRKDKDGKTHTETVWTSVSGNVKRSFDDVPVCATSSEVNEVVDKILPYSTSQGSLPYDPAYLSGMYAEHYSLKCQDGLNIAKRSVESELRNAAEKDILHKGYDLATVDKMENDYKNIVYKHVMLPAWVSAFTYKGKSYKYIINGETGKVGGKRPYSAVKIILAVLVALAILSLIVFVSTKDDTSDDVSFREYDEEKYSLNADYNYLTEEEYDYGMVRTR